MRRSWIAPLAWYVYGRVVRGGISRDLGARGMFHKPFSVFLVPSRIMSPFLYILTLDLLNNATQSSSQSWPMDKSEDWRSLKMWPEDACVDRAGESGMLTLCDGVIVFPLATRTEGPVVVWCTWVQCVVVAGVR